MAAGDGAPPPVSVSPEAFLHMGREVLAQQPFSVLIDAELTALAPGQCELQVPITDQIKQQHGFVHGGVLSYAADNALTYAGGTALRVPVVTSEFKINYVRPAIGERLVARARRARRPHAGRVPLRGVRGRAGREKAVRAGAGHHRGAARQAMTAAAIVFESSEP